MFERVNKKRKKHIPIMVMAIIYAIFYFSFVIFYIIQNKSIALLENIILMVVSIIGVVGTSFTAIYASDFYDFSVMPIARKDFLDKTLSDFGLKFSNKKVSKEERKSLKKSQLLGKSHQLSVIHKIIGNDITIYEISMLSDLRFRGYLIKTTAKEENKTLDYVICNIKYYYRHRPKGFQKTTTDSDYFNKRFKIYTKRKHIFNKTRLDNLKRSTINYNHIGFSKIGNDKYILLSYNIKDGQRLFVPGVFLEFNDDYLLRVEKEIENYLELAKLVIE